MSTNPSSKSVATEIISARTGKNIVMPETSVLIDDPESVSEFIKGGNLVVILWHVIIELDGLKKSRDVGYEAQKAIKKIHALLLSNANIVVERKMNFSKNDLDKTLPDHRIIAGVNSVLQEKNRPKSPYFGYDKVKLVTNDYGMQIFAREIGAKFSLIVEFYQKDRAKLRKEALIIRTKNIPFDLIKKDRDKNEYYPLSGSERIPENGPVIIYSGEDSNWQPYCAAVRQGNNLVFLDSRINAAGIYAKGNGHTNWAQIIALHFLTDDKVKCVFLQGGAGTGKTILALAAGLDGKRRKLYSRLIVSRPTIPLNEDDNLGWLPGDINQKFYPWLLPIRQNLAIIKPEKKSKEAEEDKSELDIMAKHGVEIQPLAYIRGSTFNGAFIIIDEAQNLTRHQMKTIITRAGQGTKIVFTGDLGQIDNPRLTRDNSGLTHAIARMGRDRLVGIVNFQQTVRSELVELAERVL
jgi:PhoH-like ATPase